jgi:hypothetical protein
MIVVNRDKTSLRVKTTTRMMRSLFLALLVVVCLTACSGPDLPSEGATLFDGSDLDAFNAVGDANWTIEGDTVRANEGEGFLVTADTFDNFELEVEFWADEPANSGIFVRCQDPGDIAATTCYEVNIFDTRTDQTYRTGGIVDVASPRAFVHAADRWNRFRIAAEGTRLTVELNGVAMVDAEDGRFASGHIGLQRGAGTIIFRNVRIRPL